MSVTAIHLVVHGRVQAVGYRRWAQDTARELNLNGWVRNKNDGTVEIVMSGETANIARMHTMCERGPVNAHVIRVDMEPWTGDVEDRFEQLETD